MTPTACLLAAVEAGSLWPDDAVVIPKDVSDVMGECFDDVQFADFAAAYDGSVNDAISLCVAMLPGFAWGRQWSGHMWVEPKESGQRYYSPDNMADDPARALLIAMLRALVAQEGGE